MTTVDYRASLPYLPQGEAALNEHAQGMLDDLRAGLAQSVLADDFPAGAFFWVKQVHKYLELKNPMSVDVRLEIIRLLYDMFAADNVDLGFQTTVAGLLVRLVKKHDQLKDAGLVLPWQPFHRIIEQVYFPAERTHVWVDVAKHSTNLFAFLKCARRYFADAATEEILDEFRPSLVPFQESVYKTQGYLVRLLPVDDAAKAQLWLKEIMDFWNVMQNIRNWDIQWMALISKVASRTIGEIDWEPYLPLIYSKGLASFELPVGSGQAPSFAHDFDQSFHIFMKHNKEYPTMLARFIASTIQPEGSSLVHLRQFLQVIETFLHPSNNGKWSAGLTRFLSSFVASLLWRIKNEKEPTCTVKPEHRLSKEFLDSLVKDLVPLVFLAMFAKSGLVTLNAHNMLKNLGYIAPEIVFPQFVERVAPALDNVTEAHRTLSILGALSVVGSPLSNRHVYNDGAYHVVNFLDMALPGIDMNDPLKSFSSLTFVTNVAFTITFGNASAAKQQWGTGKEDWSDADYEVAGVTGEPMEAWLIAFFDKIFNLMQNFPEEHGKTAKMSIENGLTQMVVHTIDTLADALLPDYHAIALDRVARFVLSSIIPSARKAAGNMCRSVVSVYPAVGLKKLLPPICARIIEEVDSGAGADVFAPEEAERALTWFQTLAYFVVKNSGTELLNYKDLILSTLKRTLPLAHRKAHKLAGKLLRHVLRSLISTYPVETRVVPLGVWNSHEYQANHFKYWGQKADPANLEITWHIPNEKEIAFALELVQSFVVPEVAKLEALLGQDPKGTPASKIFHSLMTVRNGLSGIGTLIAPSESTATANGGADAMDVDGKSDDDDGTWKRHTIVAGYCITDKTNARYVEVSKLRERVGTALHLLVQFCGSLKEDDYRTMNLLVKVITLLLCSRGTTVKKARSALKGYDHLKSSLRDPTVKGKAHPRQLILYRVWVLHMFRLMHSSTVIYASKLETDLVMDLTNLSIANNYAKIRTKAQTHLHSTLSLYPKLKAKVLGVVIQSLASPEHHVLKGGLYTIRIKPLMNTLTRTWKFQSQAILAMCQAQQDQKPSTQEMLRKVSQEFTMRFQTLSIESSKYDHLRKSASAILEKLTGNALAGPAGKRNKAAVDNRAIYHSTVTTLLGMLESGKLHWRFEMMAADSVSMLLRPDAGRDLPMDWFYKSMTADLPFARSLAMTTTTRLLYMLKSPRASSEGDDMQETSNYKVQIKTGFEHATVSLEKTKQAMTELTEYPAKLFVDSIALGFLYWPTSYEAYVPNIARPVQATGFAIEKLAALIQTDEFWTKLVATFAEERGQESGSSKYDTGHVDILHSLGRHFGPIVFEKIKGPFEGLCAKPAEKTHKRAAAEVFAGIISGSKQWTTEQAAALGDYFKPYLKILFANITPDSRADWESALLDCFSNRDFRRNKWLVDFIFSYETDPSCSYSFEETLKISFKRTMFEMMRCRLNEQALVELEKLQPFLAHPYKQMRDEIGLMIDEILLTTWHPQLHGDSQNPTQVTAFMDSLVTKLVDAREKAKALSPEEVLANPPEYTRLAKTVVTCVYSGLGSVCPIVGIYLPKLLPHLFVMLEDNDQDLQKMIKALLVMFPRLIFTGAQVSELLNQLVHISRSTSWHVRVKVLPTLQIFVFHNIFQFDENMMNATLDMIMVLMEDPQVEVRELAGKTLSGIIRCANRSSGARLKDHFSRMLGTKVANKKKPEPEALLRRHVGVLGLSALVLAFPYEIPTWMPEVLEHLTRHMNDPAPVQTTVKQTMAEFRRTHQESWHLDREKFTDDQLSALTDLLVSPSYYA